MATDVILGCRRESSAAERILASLECPYRTQGPNTSLFIVLWLSSSAKLIPRDGCDLYPVDVIYSTLTSEAGSSAVASSVGSKCETTMALPRWLTANWIS